MMPQMPAPRTWSGSFENHLVQWPVGHGGFFTQDIEFTAYPLSNLNSKVHAGSLNIIYDCGSWTRKKPRKEIVQAIDDYVSGFTGADIDLLVISHFDQDHINGLTHLASALRQRGIQVKRVWAPLLTPLERLELIVIVENDEGQPSDADRRMILDPEDEISELFPDAETQLLEPNTGEAPPTPPAPIAVDDGEGGNQSVAKVDGPRKQSIFVQSNTINSPEILWEVCPFVTASTLNSSVQVETAVRAVLHKSPRDCTIYDLKKIASDTVLLDDFRKAVLIEHKKNGLPSSRGLGGGTGHNLSSVCVYSGPVAPYSWNRNRGWGLKNPLAPLQTPWPPPIAPSWLGTGDAVFARSFQVDEMKAVLGAGRIDRVGVMSAPHHGSTGDCCAALWNGFANLEIVTLEGDHKMGTAKGRRGHPHAQVLADLTSNNLPYRVVTRDPVDKFELTDKRHR
ncbi:MBL fold metallo-hydrolase [Brevibacterium aurantiacum]|uniref:MBL fold metallo-hydrolase n=1 Tax=Brevibacterium aurantiacum TaxID=273384 RepID=UPI000DF1A3E9|nr:MBL fold metallo-hydrolase [Brevibacterium aurantiacum]RCS92493.1 MBL fold metallo-hydrolase [Brevibacterium aurantiacum]